MTKSNQLIILLALFVTCLGAALIVHAETITSFSDGSSDIIISDSDHTSLIASHPMMNVTNSSIKVTGLPIIEVEGDAVGNLVNGDFETGNSQGWQRWGDPNNCAEDTICPTTWCDLDSNASCSVKSMFGDITNNTAFGSYAAVLGHYGSDAYTYAASKIDLRQNITLPNKTAVLSFNARVLSDNFNSGIYDYYIILDDGTEHVIWSLNDGSPDVLTLNSWTPFALNLSGYEGKNVTLILRLMQNFRAMGRPWDVMWSGTSLWYVDNVIIISASSLSYIIHYPQFPSIDVGADGIKEWRYPGILNASIIASNLSTAITNYLRDCIPDANNYCYVPLAIHIESLGKLRLSNIYIEENDKSDPSIGDISFQTNLFQNMLQQIFVTAHDNVNITSVKIFLTNDDVNMTLNATLFAGSIWNGTWTTSVNSLQPGNYSVYVLATDGSGNRATSPIVQFTVLPDQDPPILSNNTRNYETDFIRLSSAILDNGSGFDINACQFCPSLQGNCVYRWQPVNIVLDNNNMTGHCTYDWFANFYPEGFYDLILEATDKSGNIANYSIQVFTQLIETQNIVGNMTIVYLSDAFDAYLDIVMKDNFGSELIFISKQIPNSTPVGLTTFKAINIAADPSILSYMSEAHLSMYFNETELSEKNITVSNIRMYYFNETSQNWEILAIQGLDIINDYMWAKVSHFGIYGIFGNTTTYPLLPVCGNGIIETGETCDNSAQNGACPNSCSASCTINTCTSASRGGGGGGGGGGAISKNESWNCTDWSDCANGKQTQSCKSAIAKKTNTKNCTMPVTTVPAPVNDVNVGGARPSEAENTAQNTDLKSDAVASENIVNNSMAGITGGVVQESGSGNTQRTGFVVVGIIVALSAITALAVLLVRRNRAIKP